MSNKRGLYSHRNSNETIIGDFFVTYTAINSITGKRYTTVNTTPSRLNKDTPITADQVNDIWQSKYNGNSPFSGDPGFEVIKLQQRTEF